MPQDIPLEAGETLAFTPPSLAHISSAPTFVLRTPSPREKRRIFRVHREEGVRTHSVEDIRRETLEGLKALWSPEAFDQHSPILKEFWAAQDEFALQKKDDDTLKWSYDPEIEKACRELMKSVAESHRPLRKMHADNADYSEIHPVIFVSVMLKRYIGLDVPREVEGGYLTLDCTHAISDALEKLESQHGLATGTAFGEIYAAAITRTYLGEEEAKNFVSPSPSETIPAASTPMWISEADGSSPESTAPSIETQEAE